MPITASVLSDTEVFLRSIVRYTIAKRSITPEWACRDNTATGKHVNPILLPYCGDTIGIVTMYGLVRSGRKRLYKTNRHSNEMGTEYGCNSPILNRHSVLNRTRRYVISGELSLAFVYVELPLLKLITK